MLVGLGEGDLGAFLGDGDALAHLQPELDGLGTGGAFEDPELVVAGAADTDVLEMFGADEDVVAVREVHDPQE